MNSALLPFSPLWWIKLLHTTVWLFLVCCILALPLAASRGHFRTAAALSAVVLMECLVLALNRFRCPLTNTATRYSSDSSANFDIFLPAWLARHNQLIFGTLFFAGLFFSVQRYFRMAR